MSIYSCRLHISCAFHKYKIWYIKYCVIYYFVPFPNSISNFYQMLYCTNHPLYSHDLYHLSRVNLYTFTSFGRDNCHLKNFYCLCSVLLDLRWRNINFYWTSWPRTLTHHCSRFHLQNAILFSLTRVRIKLLEFRRYRSTKKSRMF